jgi:hypothetical protein
MPVMLIERRGSGDFSRGPGEPGQGKILFAVLGAADQDEALLEAENDPRAAPVINDYLRGKGAVTDLGDALCFVDFDYTRAIPNEADAGAGDTPASSRPTPPGGHPNTDKVGRDMSFSTGGQTRNIKYSKETRYRRGRDGDFAPFFNKLIGVDLKSGEIHGCDVLSPTCDFTITKRYEALDLGWLRFMLDCTACTNESVIFNMDIGEVLFKGADGQYKDGDPKPWTVTGRFGYSRNMTLANNPDDCMFGEPGASISVPDIEGWNYVWIIPKIIPRTYFENGVAKQQIVSIPRFVYVERVYDRAELNELGFV